MKSTMRAVLFGIVASTGAIVVACGSSSDASPPSTPTVDDAASPPGNNDSSPDASTPTPESDAGSEPKLPLGPPITAPPSTWTWVDVPEAVCDDGTPTGLGIWPSPGSKKLMFFFAGGGACWNFENCATKPSYAEGPFGKTEFDKNSPGFGGWIIGHGENNPFKDWNTVFIPYCTGDIHAGDNVKTYTDGKTSKVVHHKGRANLAAYLARLGATFPDAEQIASTGSSAGGGGALFSYPAIRAYWPNAQGFLVDDSLPFFKAAIPLDIRQAWFENWNLDPITTPVCGPNCVEDMSKLFTGMSARYPNDRMGVVSFTTDYVIAGYYKIDVWNYWKVLADFSKTAIEPTTNFKRFHVDTWGHGMLTNIGGYSVSGTKLTNWLAQMASADPAWKSVP